jgi:hypothetical protein
MVEQVGDTPDADIAETLGAFATKTLHLTDVDGGETTE